MKALSFISSMAIVLIVAANATELPEAYRMPWRFQGGDACVSMDLSKAGKANGTLVVCSQNWFAKDDGCDSFVVEKITQLNDPYSDWYTVEAKEEGTCAYVDQKASNGDIEMQVCANTPPSENYMTEGSCGAFHVVVMGNLIAMLILTLWTGITSRTI